MCPDWDDTQPTEPLWPGLYLLTQEPEPYASAEGGWALRSGSAGPPGGDRVGRWDFTPRQRRRLPLGLVRPPHGGERQGSLRAPTPRQRKTTRLGTCRLGVARGDPGFQPLPEQPGPRALATSRSFSDAVPARLVRGPATPLLARPPPALIGRCSEPLPLIGQFSETRSRTIIRPFFQAPSFFVTLIRQSSLGPGAAARRESCSWTRSPDSGSLRSAPARDLDSAGGAGDPRRQGSSSHQVTAGLCPILRTNLS